ncbi:hypothetical protein SEA_STROSAHL_23 [Gordonia phage Strosahl]|uniref:Head-to-tail connector protein n=5 Tax=Soupsvirus TaxID=1982562 RepID=A0A160DGE2_9CAUD|nr:tail completion or Neck1 protein [Gordonia phage Rosalind]YP_009269043.1 tail completion or Neck1 protein [Gordonia phage KatherineG]YP_009269321.1 tail completion or Neck1 protein [Gordonia phage Soups]YP_009281634.1 tail completion or Neck1 protein [Gordonia phage Remus]YP_009285964.1 tail completion or Neck1 protein [Gordonia phage JSwag]YP_009596224.1 tail completion or Neck1 protein [Gordonia phage Strosahl]YP_009624538.1 tail completion or Neck1 protein [Gordonia phage Waits]ASZ7390
MTVRLIGQKAMNTVISHLPEVRDAVKKEGRKIERRAEKNLAKARASTQWDKIFGPDHLTTVSGDMGITDYLVHLNAPNAMAIEFGHAPSGVFGPNGSLGHIETKAPDGLYIIVRAAGLAGAT